MYAFHLLRNTDNSDFVCIHSISILYSVYHVSQCLGKKTDNIILIELTLVVTDFGDVAVALDEKTIYPVLVMLSLVPTDEFVPNFIHFS